MSGPGKAPAWLASTLLLTTLALAPASWAEERPVPAPGKSPAAEQPSTQPQEKTPMAQPQDGTPMAPPVARKEPPSAADNYRIPVPPDLQQRQLEANRRLDALRQADQQARLKAEQQREEAQRQAQQPERPAMTVPMYGFMYH